MGANTRILFEWRISQYVMHSHPKSWHFTHIVVLVSADSKTPKRFIFSTTCKLKVGITKTGTVAKHMRLSAKHYIFVKTSNTSCNVSLNKPNDIKFSSIISSSQVYKCILAVFSRKAALSRRSLHSGKCTHTCSATTLELFLKPPPYNCTKLPIDSEK